MNKIINLKLTQIESKTKINLNIRQMDIEKYKENIKKTGFFLEFEIAQLLKKNSWSIISNRYYVDDQTETIREIDIIGYKVGRVGETLIYTTLLISCKKNQNNLWALLARDVNLTDPNAEWHPLHVWSNNLVLSYMINNSVWKPDYLKTLANGGVKYLKDIPDVDIFAFQEMNIKKGTVQNDKAIFNSITSLMKAQAYEISSLPNRKKEDVVYQFTQVSHPILRVNK